MAGAGVSLRRDRAGLPGSPPTGTPLHPWLARLLTDLAGSTGGLVITALPGSVPALRRTTVASAAVTTATADLGARIKDGDFTHPHTAGGCARPPCRQRRFPVR